MTNLKDKLHERVFVPTSVKNELPENGKLYSVSMDEGKSFQYIGTGKDWKPEELGYTHFLKPSPEPSYLLTPLELLELRKKWASEDWDAAENRTNYDKYQFEGWETIPADKETYINSLNL